MFDFLQNLGDRDSSQEVRDRLSAVEQNLGNLSSAVHGLPDRFETIVNRATTGGGGAGGGSGGGVGVGVGVSNLADSGTELGTTPDINRAANEIRNYLQEFRRMGVDFVGQQRTILLEERTRLNAALSTAGDDAARESITQELDIVNNNSRALERLSSALPNLASRIESSGERASRGLATMISGIASAFMVQQILTMRNITLPYQYETRPALSALGSSGMMGELLGGAFGAQEEVLQGFRQMAPTAGAALGGGLGSLGFLAGRGFGVAGMALGGVAGGIAGTIPIVNDALTNALDFATGNFSQTAFQTSIGTALVDANKFKEITRAGLVPQLAFSDVFSRADNQVDFLQAGVSDEARAMGYGPMESAQFTTAVLTSLPLSALNTENTRFQTEAMQNESDRQFAAVSGLLNLSATLESRGMDREASLDLYSTLARAGSEDIIKSVSTLVSATSQDGVATDYTLNVLVPALSRVVESRAIANISRSSEEIERESSGIFSFIRNSGTRLADLIEKNPDAVLSQITGMIDQAGEAALNDPARMMFLNQLGIPFMDVVGKNADILYKPIEFFRGMASFDSSGRINREESLFTAFQMLQVMGIQATGTNLQYAFELLESGGDQAKVANVLKKIETEDPLSRIAKALEEFVGTAPGTVLASITTQAEQFYAALTGNVTNILAMQRAIQAALDDNNVVTNAANIAMSTFINEIANMVENLGDITRADAIRSLAPIPTNSSLIEEIFSGDLGGVQGKITREGKMSNLNFYRGENGNFEQIRDEELLAFHTNRQIAMLPENQRALARAIAEGNPDASMLAFSSILKSMTDEELKDFLRDYFQHKNNTSSSTQMLDNNNPRATSNMSYPSGTRGATYSMVGRGQGTTATSRRGSQSDQAYSLENLEDGHITVTLDFANTNPQEIIEAAVNAARHVLVSERLV